MPQTFERTPPQDIELEMQVLGGVMLEPKEAFPLVAERLTADAFYLDGHQLIFELMGELHARGIPPDSVAVVTELRARELEHKVGGLGVLMAMLNSVPTAAGVEHHAQLVANKFLLRRLFHANTVSSELAYRQDQAPEDVLGAAQDTLARLALGTARSSLRPVGELASAGIERLNETIRERDELLAKGQRVMPSNAGLATGMVDLDARLGGWQFGELQVIAARPSMGKTALALTIAWDLAVRRRMPVGFLSLEMSAQAVTDRLLSMGTWTSQGVAWIDTVSMRRGDVTEAQGHALRQALGQLSTAPLLIDDPSELGIAGVLAAVRDMARKGAQCVMVDYLGLIAHDERYANRAQEIGEQVRRLKQVAKALRIVLVLLAQLNRETERRGDKRPAVSDFRDSGMIEEHADSIVFIYRDDYYTRAEGEPGALLPAELDAAKARNGRRGVTHCGFIPEVAKFVNIARR